MSDLSGAAEGCVGLQGRRSVWFPSDRRFVRKSLVRKSCKSPLSIVTRGNLDMGSRDGVQDEAACAGETEKVHNVIKISVRRPNCFQVASKIMGRKPPPGLAPFQACQPA